MPRALRESDLSSAGLHRTAASRSSTGDVRKVLLLGSGAIKIAEAAEFDYSGSQAIKALKEEGIEVVVVNPNVATIQTSKELADKVYLLPVQPDFVERVIERERPDGILLGFGGQAALNCGVELARRGVLDRYGVKVLGTPVESIVRASDRNLFRKTMVEHGIPVPPSRAAYSPSEAIEAAEEIGYPVMVRVAFNLGGAGSFVAWSREQLSEGIAKAFAQSPVKQVLVEKYLDKWKEVEFEVVRDSADNAVAVACLENVDPMGVHTGDSIVVAPSQTLTNREYQALRDASLAVARAIGVVGECNVQLALDPRSEEFYVIETNPRMSRSSALASKATGYPLAYIAAKLALGYRLPELMNTVTGVTTAHFEPALDYVVVKVPRWDFEKFPGVKPVIGTEMRSIGEVMAIGRCFEEALQKALRMLDIGARGLVANPWDREPRPAEELRRELAEQKPYRVFLIAEALKAGLQVEEISRLTGIDPWYIYKMKRIVDLERELRRLGGLGDTERAVELIREAKRLGFSDAQIAACLGVDEREVRAFRKRHGILPAVKQIDTLAAEWPARTKYLYVTYGGDAHDVEPAGRGAVVVIGAGVFRIGVSVEFDWSVVQLVWALRKRGVETIVVNYNPETVSTDWDVPDRLYFEELTLERVLDIYEFEDPMGVVACVGGQIANNLAPLLEECGVRILGPSGEAVERAEDRRKFSRLLDELGIPQPPWAELRSPEEVISFCRRVGYPVIVRPSFVLSGTAMRVVRSEGELLSYLNDVARRGSVGKFVVSKFIEEAREVEVDCVSDGNRVLIGAVIEHIEEAGVHSGDATLVIPPFSLSQDVLDKVRRYTLEICRALKARGPVNIQFVVKGSDVYVIECNLRASRTMPFVSKVKGVNLMDYVADVILGRELDIPGEVYEPPAFRWGVKTPQFSWSRLRGAYPVLDVEMRSTGEVAAVGFSLQEALLKSWLAAQPNTLPEPGSTVLIVGDGDDLAERLERLGFKPLVVEPAALDGRVNELVLRGVVKAVIACGGDGKDYSVRRAAADYMVPLLLNRRLAVHLLEAIEYYRSGGPLSVEPL
ncbi:MAG: carbamoyl-phosphate synthase (glutamine-hydrolyzing) large subunit [Thermofilaceae archaeon]